MPDENIQLKIVWSIFVINGKNERRKRRKLFRSIHQSFYHMRALMTHQTFRHSKENPLQLSQVYKLFSSTIKYNQLDFSYFIPANMHKSSI